jgi:DNA-binding MarR family transcriptional regulator
MELTITALAAQLRGFSEYLQRVGAELFREAFRTHGIKDLSVQQLRYLEIIEGKPGTSPRDLAAAFNVKKPTVSNVIERLEKLGLIRRETSPDDKRVCRLHPTETTEKIFKKRRSMYHKLAAHIAGRLSGSQIRNLVSLFDLIVIEEER